MIDVSLYLKELEQYNVKAEPNLVELCECHSGDPERLINAFYVLKEAHDQKRVKNPIGYIYKAIEKGWVSDLVSFF